MGEIKKDLAAGMNLEEAIQAVKADHGLEDDHKISESIIDAAAKVVDEEVHDIEDEIKKDLEAGMNLEEAIQAVKEEHELEDQPVAEDIITIAAAAVDEEVHEIEDEIKKDLAAGMNLEEAIQAVKADHELEDDHKISESIIDAAAKVVEEEVHDIEDEIKKDLAEGMNIEEAIQAVKEEHELDGEHKVSAAVIVAAVEAVTDEDVHLTIDDIKYERNVTDGTEQLVDAEDVTSEVSVDTVVEKPAFRRESTTGSDNQQQHQHEKKAQDEHDPYSMFQVESHVCDILYVNVMEGKNITNGTFNDLVDTPDPYVQLCIFEAPDSLRTTDTSSNTSNPQWFETFKFLLYQEPKEPTLLKISLMDSDLNADDTMGAVEFDVNEIKIGDKIKRPS